MISSSDNDNKKQLSPLKRAFIALEEMQAKLKALERKEKEPIAIIGIGCRFPGANNPDAFWQLLKNGVDAITEIPPNRWDIDAYYDATPGLPGKIYTRYGGFIEDVDLFKVVAPAEFEVVEVVGRRDLDRAAAELLVDIFVGDDRDLAVHQRQQHLFADQVGVAFVLGMHGDGGIAEHRLGTGGRHHQVPVGADHRVAQVPQMPLLILVFDLEV